MSNKRNILVFILIFALIGTAVLIIGRAATPSASIEPEDGAISGCATKVSDPNASGGSAVQFGGTPGCGGSVASTAGAQLPITYDINSLPGTKRFVAMGGSDSAAGTLAAPFATLTQAVKASAANDTIVVRGGTYSNDSQVNLFKSVKIIAYPGEIPTFTGAVDISATSGWTTDGNNKYQLYTPQPYANNFNSFSEAENLYPDQTGKLTDQAWIGNQQLRQVATLAQLGDGKFFVDASNNRLYMTSTDVAKGNLQVSRKTWFLRANRQTTVEGIRITRFANSPDHAAVVFTDTISGSTNYSADDSLMKNVEISGSAFQAVTFRGGSTVSDVRTILKGVTFKNVTIAESNWMGLVAMYTDDLTLDAVKISGNNQFVEFKNSPQSGALKTSRTHRTNVTSSIISGNNGHGLWFDESNYDVDVANNQILDNKGTGVFFEISDNLTLANNYIRSAAGYQSVKLAGSSGLKIVNNTIVGDADPIGVYADGRSKGDCWDRTRSGGVCTDVGALRSNWDLMRPQVETMDWKPRIDLMINNIVASPKKNGLCGAFTPVCILTKHVAMPTDLGIASVIHKADTSRGIPQTRMDGNVYVNDGGSIIITLGTAQVKYSTISSFTTAMKTATGIDGIDASSKQGSAWVNPDGSPTSTLSAVHNQAIPIPTNAELNQYLPAGTRHYGVKQ